MTGGQYSTNPLPTSSKRLTGKINEIYRDYVKQFFGYNQIMTLSAIITKKTAMVAILYSIFLNFPALAIKAYSEELNSCHKSLAGRKFYDIGGSIFSFPQNQRHTVDFPAQSHEQSSVKISGDCLETPIKTNNYKFIPPEEGFLDKSYPEKFDGLNNLDTLEFINVTAYGNPNKTWSGEDFSNLSADRCFESGGPKNNIMNGLIQCLLSKSQPTEPDKYSASVYLAPQQIYTTPLGSKFVIICLGPLETSGFCSVKYLISKKIGIDYTFRVGSASKKHVDIENIIEFDKRLREFISYSLSDDVPLK